MAADTNHPLLNGLPVNRLYALLGPIKPRTVSAGRPLHSPNTETGHLYLVLSGVLRAYEITSDGREILMEIIGPGGFDGILPARGLRGHFTEALSDARVLSLSRGQVDALLTDPPTAKRLIELIVGRLKDREDQLRMLAIREPEQRLAALLLYLGQKLGKREGTEITIAHRLTHQALAHMLGIRRETVTHAFHRLTAAGAARSADGRIVLHVSNLRHRLG
jgi:CRP-like cAMP-binding protein